MRIGRLSIAITGTAAEGQAFARHFTQALGRALPDPSLQGVVLDRLELPPVQARPGESGRRLAERTAAAVVAALSAQGRTGGTP